MGNCYISILFAITYRIKIDKITKSNTFFANENNSLSLNNTTLLDDKNKIDKKLQNVSLVCKESTDILDEVMNLFVRYDDAYIKEHNWVVGNVKFFETGVYILDSSLATVKKIQEEYLLSEKKLINLADKISN